MQVCLMIEGQEGVTWEEWVHLAELGERLGFAGLFRSDHYSSLMGDGERRSLDAWATLCGLAARTERLRLGTLVSPVTFRHPAVLAGMVATADHISGGRVELGLGAGWNEEEHLDHGFEFPAVGDRLTMLERHLEIVRSVWTSDHPVGTNPNLRHPRLPRPVQRPHPPLLVGGGAGPRVAALAACWADEYNVYETGPDEIGPKWERLVAACEAIGRDPETLRLSAMTPILVAADPNTLERRAFSQIEFLGLESDLAAHLDDPSRSRLVGTPEEVIHQIGDFAAAGVGRLMLQIFPHNDFEMIELIGESIVPQVAEMATPTEGR